MQLYQSNLGIPSLGILLNTPVQNFWSVLRTTLFPAFIRNTFPMWHCLSLQCLASLHIDPSEICISIPCSKHSWLWPPPWGCGKPSDCGTSCVMLWNVAVSHWQIWDTLLCFSTLQVPLQAGAAGLGHLISSAATVLTLWFLMCSNPAHKRREKWHLHQHTMAALEREQRPIWVTSAGEDREYGRCSVSVFSGDGIGVAVGI